MMLPTHALGGMMLGLAFGAIFPEFGGIALLAGLLGGIFPDLDMYAGHRKSLHFPVYYSTVAPGALVLATLVPSLVTVGAALFLLGAAVHSVSDVFGGGLELRPWEGTSDRAVYDHHRGRWLAPRRWIGYDGSPTDLLLAGLIAVPLLVTLDGIPRAVVVGSLAVGVLYTTLRRVLPRIAEALVATFVPEPLLEHVPDRYVRAAHH